MVKSVSKNEKWWEIESLHNSTVSLLWGHMGQKIIVNITSNGTKGPQVAIDKMNWEGHIISMVFLIKMNNQNLIMKIY